LWRAIAKPPERLVGPRPSRTVVALALVLSGCGSATELPPPAEPAVSPPLRERPAGRVLSLAGMPEGLAADPRTHLVAVGLRDPDRLVLVDGRSGRVVRRVRIAESPRHLQLARPGGPVLVPAERANALVQVALPSGRATTVPVGRFPHDATAAGRRFFVANEFGDSVSVVERGRVVRSLPAPVQPGGLAALPDGRVGVIAVRSNALEVYDGRTLRSLGRTGAGIGPTHIVAAPGRRFFVTDTRGDALLSFGAGPRPHIFDRANVPGAPYGIALDRRRGRLWVTQTAFNRVVEFRLGKRAPTRVRSYPTVRQPNTVAVDEATGRVFVAGRVRGELQLLDPR